MSNEIPLAKAPSLLGEDREGQFDLIASTPAKSHRSPSPLWQDMFDEVSGVLVHVGDPASSRVNDGRFCLYETIKMTARGQKKFVFLPAWRDRYARLMRDLFSMQDGSTLSVTFDTWLCELRPRTLAMSIERFCSLVQRGSPLRNNTHYALSTGETA